MTTEIEVLVQRAAEALVKVGAREVYLFGSAAKDRSGPVSDIDLAVVGLPPVLFFRAVGLVRRILKRSVDLVDLDESNPFTDYLKQSGELKRVA
ncbi:MAG: nucleotidyltransferase domain-containing protein [Pseudomonadota bacterium]